MWTRSRWPDADTWELFRLELEHTPDIANVCMFARPGDDYWGEVCYFSQVLVWANRDLQAEAMGIYHNAVENAIQ